MAKAGKDRTRSAGGAWLKSLFGGDASRNDRPAGPDDQKRQEEERFRTLLGSLPASPDARELRELMSASYRAGRYAECQAIVGYYENCGFEDPGFVKRTKELLERHDVVDLGRIFAPIRTLTPAPANQKRAEAPVPQFAPMKPQDDAAFLADLSVLAMADGPVDAEIDVAVDEPARAIRFDTGAGSHLVSVVIPVSDRLPNGIMAVIRAVDGTDSAHHPVHSRVVRDTHYAVCAFVTQDAERIELSLQEDESEGPEFLWEGARVCSYDATNLSPEVAALAPLLTPEAALGMRADALGEDANAADIDALVETVRRSTYSRQFFATLLAANISRPEHRDLYLGWRRRIANILLRDDPSGEDAYQVASNLVFRFRELRAAAEISTRALTTSSKKLREARRLKFEQFAGRALMLDRHPAFPRGLAPAFDPHANLVLYCLHQARPTDSNGYAVRSHALLKALGETRWSVEGVTRAGYGLEGRSPDTLIELEGVSYHAMRGPNISLVSDWAYVHAAADELERVVRRERPAIVHAASSHANAWPALVAARRCGLPFVYEVRGFWEMSHAAKEPWVEGSDTSALTIANDTRIAIEADAVLVLTRAMKRELVARGVDGDKISVAPNAVDLADFPPRARDKAQLASLGLDPELPTVGYVGSVVAYEGLELLVESLSKVRDAGVRFNFLLVGDGNALDDVKKAIERHGLGERSVCTGRVDREQANALYALIDICPFPRLPLPVSENVSPLKPFEAMAQGKTIVASDVAAMAEFIVDGTNGRLFSKGDSQSLAQVLQSLLADPAAMETLGAGAREWVRDNRQWSGTASVVAAVYDGLAERAQASSTPRERSPYEVVSSPREIATFEGEAGRWFTVTGHAAPMHYDERGARVILTITNGQPGPLFASAQDALAAGFEMRNGTELVVKPAIAHDGLYRFRGRLPDAGGPFHLTLAPEPFNALYASGRVEVETDEAGEARRIDRKLRVAIIADKFTTAALSGVADCTPITRSGFREEMSDQDVDLFVCESAWEGNGGEWHQCVGHYGDEAAQDLRAVVKHCREKGIPTVFFNKEDPVHFNRFNKTAAMFDVVVTTDLDSVPNYLSLPQSQIQFAVAKPFFTSPAVHHPFSQDERRNDFCYAGTYYGARYADRTKQLDMLLEAAADTKKLVVYDRHADVEGSPYALPDALRRFSKGGLDYSEMLEAYRHHGTFLNANSVPDSETMFSRRVVEALASGAAVVTARSRAVRKQFHGRVPEVSTLNQAHRLLTRIERHPEVRTFFARTGMRIALREHSATHWLSDVARLAGLETPDFSALATYSVVVEGEGWSDDRHLLSFIDAMITQSHPPLAVTILGVDHGTFAETTLRKAERLAHEASVVLHFGDEEPEIARASTFVVRVDPALWFGATCMEDMLVLNGYGDADAVVASKQDDAPFAWADADAPGMVRLERREPRSGKAIVAPRFAIGAQRPSAEGRKLLVAGHDLKFITPLFPYFEQAGFTLLVDQWKGHAVHDQAKSRAMLDEADLVFCEWMLGNARWYAANVRPDQPLVGRLHRQEVITNYPRLFDIDRFDRVFYVGSSTMNVALETFGWERRGRDIVVGNAVDIHALDLPKLPDARFALGFVGMVPSLKRVDRALDILSRLRSIDPRFHLRIKGKKPSDYAWLLQREDEKAYYTKFWQRMKEDPTINASVILDAHGPDMAEWYRKVGFALSTSDLESFHLTVADGGASRAVPIILPWEGAEEIYPPEWVYADEEAAARRILELAGDEERWAEAGSAARDVIEERYSMDDIADRMIRQMLQVVPA